MTQKFHVGQKVKWQWSGSTAEGKVKQAFKEKVTRKIKGTEVTRNASEEEPAYLVEQEDGGQALKSESELESNG